MPRPIPSRIVDPGWNISLCTEEPDAIPYFNWDAPVTNREVRSALRDGTEADRLFWIARIMATAQYADVWRYVSLRRDVMPRWETLRRRLGRRRDFWNFLISSWQRDGLV